MEQELACLELEREIKEGLLYIYRLHFLLETYANYPCKAVLKTLENSNCNASYFLPRRTDILISAMQMIKKPEIEKALFRETLDN